jgi:hypothetical protein
MLHSAFHVQYIADIVKKIHVLIFLFCAVFNWKFPLSIIVAWKSLVTPKQITANTKIIEENDIFAFLKKMALYYGIITHSATKGRRYLE